MKINNNSEKIGSLGDAATKKLANIKNDILTIIFTKGKLEVETNNIERINVYDDSMNIILKTNELIFINLQNVTYIE